MWNFLETFLDPQWSPEVSCKIGSVRPPVWRLCFLGIELLVFSICRHCVRNLCVWQPCSMEKTNCTQNRQKSRCLKLLKNFIISFFDMFYTESLYSLLCSSTNLRFGKTVLELWAKILSANQIVAFWYQVCLQDKLMN